jgi:NitT/TauT family transport system substrate-binding protein
VNDESPDRPRKFLVPAIAGISLLIVAGALIFWFWEAGRFTPGVTPEVVRINIVTWPGYGPIYLGKAKGFFKEEGIEVDCRIQENTQARHAALVAGEIDLIGITLESVVLSNAEGIPMQVVGVTDISNGGDGIITKPEIKSIADLKGKRVAFPEGQPSHLFLLYELDKAGLAASDVVPVYTDDAGKAGELFVAGQVDAAVTWEPWLTTAVQNGRGNLLVSSKGVQGILIGIFAANRDRLPKSKDKLRRFLRGWYRSLDYVQAHREESIPIMARGFQLPPKEFEAILSGLRFIPHGEAEQLLGCDGQGKFSEYVQYVARLWKQARAMKSTVEPSKTYTNEILCM